MASPKSTSAPRDGVSFGADAAGFDRDLYGPTGASKYADYENEIEVGDSGSEKEELDAIPAPGAGITAPADVLREAERASETVSVQNGKKDVFDDYRPKTIIERENDYQKRRRTRLVEEGSYKEVMTNRMLEREKRDVMERIKDKLSHEAPRLVDEPPPSIAPSMASSVVMGKDKVRKRSRWDVAENGSIAGASLVTQTTMQTPVAPPAHGKSRWDQTPLVGTKRKWDIPGTPVTGTPVIGASSWDATPVITTKPAAKRSRWDETPDVRAVSLGNALATPLTSAIPSAIPGSMTPELYHALRMQADIDERNRPMSDSELDEVLPSEGYKILEVPSGYVPLRKQARKFMGTPAAPGTPLYILPGQGGIARDALGLPMDLPQNLQGLDMKPGDYETFSKVLRSQEGQLSSKEQKERRIMKLLLKIKNGSPHVRKVAMRTITDKAREFGAGPLLDQILTLLMKRTLDDQERHLYVKVIDRILYKLNDLVRPHVRKVLAAVGPMLIDQDYYALREGREIIANLSKAAGLNTMIATMRPAIDSPDEDERNVTARGLAVVASALGIPALLPFLRAVLRSKRSWEARHTGTKVVQQVAILLGIGVLPHLRGLVEVIEPGLTDEHGRVRTISALAVAALAEAAAPYGIESFDSVLRPLWRGTKQHRDKTLTAFLKAIGFIIPLMDPLNAGRYAREVNAILIREFRSPDEERKRIVLRVVKQCVECEGVEAKYVREEIVPEFFRCFWVRRMALDKRNYNELVRTTVEIANKIGGGEVIRKVVGDLRDELEAYRRMVVETITKVTRELGLADVDAQLEERLVDGMLFAFQEQFASNEPDATLNALSTIIEKLGRRSKKYLPRIVADVKWRLHNKDPKTRQYSADLISMIAGVIKLCDEEELLSHLCEVLYEYLGEEYPDVLGSILAGLKAITEVIGIANIRPPIGDLLPRLTPILKNRHEKVQENCILLVGRIADRGAHYISSREWMRICFELLDLLKAPRKAIRKSAVSTFGHIAKAIGPGDVLVTLLNNLKVQERTQRVCTTVAIAIVAETCQPYTVIPALMNEYRIPELNVQNGVLKSFSFLFEYIGDMAKDYIYAVTPLLEDALIDRDLVHRQTACTAVGHLALGTRGLGLEDALVHLLNHIWPNIFETSPHVINAVMFAIQGCTVAVGPATILLYLLQGLFHPARKVRDVYWMMYNNLYRSSADALVAAYPQMSNEPNKLDDPDKFDPSKYERHELHLVI
eukprot:Plantae.Rhodophyta-Hildenbrandia_rubra.ctg2816.p1 GENE.Plantae.Rhodophyta-Hildenbrandia_rubra.ctg2816~~Plantae.Rhodophyta-Hildenbrandia_rubra.ctg2816.p1  ORF type:complete len:1235 (+),score=221.06 Plantae.Rhodophyta-Hildenbrandia_rubra.ctg2816:2904-6608(+)